MQASELNPAILGKTSAMTSSDERYERGRVKRAALYGPDAEKNVAYLKELAPDLERMVMENLFGDISCRQGLDPRIRILCTLSVLVAAGREPQIRYQIGGALNMGVTKEELIEVFMQLMFYTGFPAVSTALRIAGEVFKERGL
jgi:4-carboxymuconolactone decarboxylase